MPRARSLPRGNEESGTTVSRLTAPSLLAIIAAQPFCIA